MVTGLQSAEEVTDSVGDEASVVQVRGLVRSYGEKQVLKGVDLAVEHGHVHALLGPNGAGKTTILRILVGLVQPHGGDVRVVGRTWDQLTSRSSRALFGVVPSNDRSFYYRLSAKENLRFFGRLLGLTARDATSRSEAVLMAVGLEEAAGQRVGTYSHGMLTRLAVARALLTHPPVLLVDEATHNLDPAGAARVRGLISRAAVDGAAVLWTTQRVEEIRGFADRVTLLHRGRVAFSGTIDQMTAQVDGRRFVIEVEGPDGPAQEESVRAALQGLVSVSVNGTDGHFAIGVGPEGDVGEAVVRLRGSGLRLRALREERSDIELAFLRLTGDAE